MSDGSVRSKSSGPLTPPAKHKKVVRCRCDHEEKYRDIDGARCFKVMEIDGDSDELHVKLRCPGTDGSMFNVIDNLRVLPPLPLPSKK